MPAGANPPIAIGNGARFWGDNLDAPYLLARDGRLDVLTLEYLAELTLAILGHQRAKDPAAGFVTDFGGLWHEWDQLPDLAGIGYPIAEVAADGSSVITKPAGTVGLVSVGTVTEQLLYEIDDPARYRTPDVDVDFTTLRLTENGPDRVAVRDATGRPPSDRLKLAIVYRDGWTASGMLAVVGRDAEKKARAAGAMLLERVRRAGFAFV